MLFLSENKSFGVVHKHCTFRSQAQMRCTSLLSQLCRSHVLHSDVSVVRHIATSSQTRTEKLMSETQIKQALESAPTQPMLQQSRWHLRFKAVVQATASGISLKGQAPSRSAQGMYCKAASNLRLPVAWHSHCDQHTPNCSSRTYRKHIE